MRSSSVRDSISTKRGQCHLRNDTQSHLLFSTHICTQTITTWERDTPRNKGEKTQQSLAIPGHTAFFQYGVGQTKSLWTETLIIFNKIFIIQSWWMIWLAMWSSQLLDLLTLEVSTPILSWYVVPWQPASIPKDFPNFTSLMCTVVLLRKAGYTQG